MPRFFEALDPSVAVAGYVIMRAGAVAQWLRAAAQDPAGRACALRYAVGIASCQVGWVALVVAPDDWWGPGFVALAALELAVPAWAERDAPTSWHPGHIGERYGLFTIIVLGDSVLSATVAVEAALDAGGSFPDLLTTAIGGFIVVAAMWWIYFDLPVEGLLERARRAFSALDEAQSFVWGYGHYLSSSRTPPPWASGSQSRSTRPSDTTLTDLQAAFVLTWPVSLFLLTVWVLHWRYKEPGPFRAIACPVTAAVVLATSWSGEPVLLTGFAVAALVAASLVIHSTGAAEPATEPSP